VRARRVAPAGTLAPMAGASQSTANGSANGHRHRGVGGAPPSGRDDPMADGDVRASPAAPEGSWLGRAVRAVAGQVQQRVPPADLDERDPDYIRETLPRMWL